MVALAGDGALHAVGADEAERFDRAAEAAVALVGNAEFNREDGLRSFGQLLREGKIEKTGGGRFAAAQDIGFQPGQRAAG